jgi:hypothetical protein
VIEVGAKYVSTNPSLDFVVQVTAWLKAANLVFYKDQYELYYQKSTEEFNKLYVKV